MSAPPRIGNAAASDATAPAAAGTTGYSVSVEPATPRDIPAHWRRRSAPVRAPPAASIGRKRSTDRVECGPSWRPALPIRSSKSWRRLARSGIRADAYRCRRDCCERLQRERGCARHAHRRPRGDKRLHREPADRGRVRSDPGDRRERLTDAIRGRCDTCLRLADPSGQPGDRTVRAGAREITHVMGVHQEGEPAPRAVRLYDAV
jgi:hypothetical protein